MHYLTLDKLVDKALNRKTLKYKEHILLHAHSDASQNVTGPPGALLFDRDQRSH